MDTTRELAVFLRDRRARLAPADVGIPASDRPRRTPGLRREEVAELAGVSVDYVVRLEQGRGLRPSVSVLDALARALRLDTDERRYLFDLTGQRAESLDADISEEDDTGPLERLVADLSPLPAMLINHRFDVLAWNREMAALMVDFGHLPPAERNTMRLCLTHPGFRDFYLDREQVIREGIADLRAACAVHADDTALTELVESLHAQSAEFTRLWALHDVRVYGRGTKRLAHPQAGALTVAFEVLAPLQNRDCRLIIYRAADASSQAALNRIVAGPSSLAG